MRKYIIIPFISLGILFSSFSILNVQYECIGLEPFPTYFASPFIYKSTSLGTSLAYEYYAKEFILSWLTWCVILFTIYLATRKLLLKFNNQIISTIFKMIIIGIIIVSAFEISFTVLGKFAGSNLKWENNLESESRNWDMTCKPKYKPFGL